MTTRQASNREMAAGPQPDLSTKRRIEEAALCLFAAKGFEATGIREIAERAGISSSALYHYMGSKDELLIEIMTSIMRRLLRAAEQTLEHATDAPTRLAALVRTHVSFHAEDPLRSRVSDDELRALTPEPRSRVMELRDRYELLWAAVLEDGAGGAFHFPDAKISRLALLEMCNGVIRWYSPTGSMSPAEVADIMADLALAMVEARRGGRRIGLKDLQCQPIADVLTIVREALGAVELAPVT